MAYNRHGYVEEGTTLGRPMKDLRGYLNRGEIERLLKATKCYRDYLLLKGLYYTGRRVSEFIALRPEHIDEESNQIQWHILKKKDKDAQVLMLEHAKYMEELLGYIKEAKVFSYNRIFPITRQRVHQIIRECGERADLLWLGKKKIHPHHLRHSFAINFIRHLKNPGDIVKLQRRLQHTSIGVTSHYLQFSTEEDKQILQDAFD